MAREQEFQSPQLQLPKKANDQVARHLSLLDMVAIENRLRELLGGPVDLSPLKTLKEPVRDKPSARLCLPFSEPRLSLVDIADAIGAIGEFTEGMDLEMFRADPKTIAAVERKLLVISEAAIRLGEQA